MAARGRPARIGLGLALLISSLGVVALVAPTPAAAAVTWTPGNLPTSGLNPSYGGEQEVEGVSCASATSCVAVGYYYGGSGAYSHGLIEAGTLTGTGWTWTDTTALADGNLNPLPSSPNPGVMLSGVSCTSTTCVAVGEYTAADSGNSEGLIETGTYNGSNLTWTDSTASTQGLSTDPNPDLYLDGVSCYLSSSVTSCVGVGGYQDSSGNRDGLIETGTVSGDIWSPTGTTAPGSDLTSYTVGLSAVSCASSTSCVAVGYYNISSGQFAFLAAQGLIETGSFSTGSGWTWQDSALPSIGGLEPPRYSSTTAIPLSGVSCYASASATSCVAVGSYLDNETQFEPFFASGTVSGTTWTSNDGGTLPTGALSPSPSSPGGNYDLGVSCTSASSCVAVGTYLSGGFDGVMETGAFSAGSWSWVDSNVTTGGLNPTPSPDSTSLTGVSCGYGTPCVSVGYYEDNSGEYDGLVETGPIPIVVDASGSQTYGGTASFSGTPASPLPNGITLNGTVTCGHVVIGSNDTAITAALAAGSYTLEGGTDCSGLTPSDAADYTVAYAPGGSFSVGKATIVVDASGSQTYGGTASFSGTPASPLPNGITLNGTVTCGHVVIGSNDTAITAALAAGSYTLEGGTDCSGLTPSDAADYTVAYAPGGSFSVGKATIVVDASGSQTYGGTASFSGTPASPLPNGITLNGTVTCGHVVIGSNDTAITAALAAGSYTLEGGTDCSGLTPSDAADYTVAYAPGGSFSVGKATIVVDASGSQTYGGTASFSGTPASPLPNGITLNGTVTCGHVVIGSNDTAITAALAAGSYTLEGETDCSGLTPEGTDPGDYTVSFATGGTFTVNKYTPMISTVLGSTSSIVLGTSMTDTATVTGVTGVIGSVAPGGTVALSWCTVPADATVCTSGTPYGQAVPPSSNNGTSISTYTLPTFSPTAAGTYCLIATFSSDTNFTTISDVTAPAIPECFSVTGAPTRTVTTPSTLPGTNIVVNNPETDAATVTGNDPYGNPTGTVTFYECGPTTTEPTTTGCTNASGTEVLSGQEPVMVGPSGTDAATATSPSFTPTLTGWYCFAAYFTPSGTNAANYQASDDTTSDECFDVVPTVNVVNVPSSIPQCSSGTDATQALYEWLNNPANVPQPTAAGNWAEPSTPTEVVFPSNACYIVNDMLYLRGFENVIFNGNGATFVQSSVSYNPGFEDQTTGIDEVPQVPAYCGSTYFNPATEADPTDALAPQNFNVMWFIEGGCDLEFENMNIVGNYDPNHPGADYKCGSPSNTGQGCLQDSGIQVAGSQRVLITDDTITGVYGDFVTVSGLHESQHLANSSGIRNPSGGLNWPAFNVTISDNTGTPPSSVSPLPSGIPCVAYLTVLLAFSCSGRQGIAVAYAETVTVSGNDMKSINADAIDIEADTAGQGQPFGTGGSGGEINISVTDNRILRYDYLISAQSLSMVANLSFTDNITDGVTAVLGNEPQNVACSPDVLAQNTIFAGNTPAVDSINSSSESGNGDITFFCSGAAQVSDNYELLSSYLNSFVNATPSSFVLSVQHNHLDNPSDCGTNCANNLNPINPKNSPDAAQATECLNYTLTPNGASNPLPGDPVTYIDPGTGPPKGLTEPASSCSLSNAVAEAEYNSYDTNAQYQANPVPTTASCQPVFVSPDCPQLTGQPNSDVGITGSFDSTGLTYTAQITPASGTALPTGSVLFWTCAYTSPSASGNSCDPSSGTPDGAQPVSDTNCSGGSPSNSVCATITVPAGASNVNQYCILAAYSGDDNYAAKGHANCNPPNPNVTDFLSTSAGNDTQTVVVTPPGALTTVPSGTVTYYTCAFDTITHNTCDAASGNLVQLSGSPVTLSALSCPVSGKNANAVAAYSACAPSPSISAPQGSDQICFYAVYSGDSNYDQGAVADLCDPSTDSSQEPRQPGPASHPSPSKKAGSSPLSCTLKGTIAFNPPLTSTSSSKEMALVYVTAKCKGGGSGAPATGFGNMSLPLPTSGCATLSPSSASTEPESLAMLWSDKGGTTVGGSEVTFSGYRPITSPSPGFQLGGPGTIVQGLLGSAGDTLSTLTLSLGLTEAQVTKDCKSTGGLATATKTTGTAVVAPASTDVCMVPAATGAQTTFTLGVADTYAVSCYGTGFVSSSTGNYPASITRSSGTLPADVTEGTSTSSSPPCTRSTSGSGTTEQYILTCDITETPTGADSGIYPVAFSAAPGANGGTTATSGTWTLIVPPEAATVPGAPRNVTATAGHASASVAFTPPSSDGGSAISSYTVTATDTTNGANGGETKSGSTSPITVTGLTNGDSYTFTVTATNGTGTGPPSAPSNAVVPTGVPGAPTNVTATAGVASASVAFTPPSSDGGLTISSYTVTATDITNSANGGETKSGSTSPIAVTGLTNGDSYTFSVSATNSAGTGPPSAPSITVVPGQTILYVAQGGSDVGTCQSQATPCATISYAVSQADPNDIIDVGPGTFYDNVLIPGSLTGLDVDGSTSGVTTVNGCQSGSVFSGCQDGSVFEVDANDVALDNLVITNGSGNPAGSGETWGGGVLVWGQNATLSDDTITANDSSYYGGGLAVRSPSVTLDDDTISDNVSEYGGGISGTTTLYDDTVSGNSALQGEGINGSGTIVDSTIAGNGDYGGQIYGGNFVVAGSIVGAPSPASGGQVDCQIAPGDTLADDGYNIDIDNSCGFSAATSLTDTDPELGPLQDNGGPTETMAPAANSPALDQIPDPTTAAGFTLCPGVDQRGVARPQGPACSIGAVEETPMTWSPPSSIDPGYIFTSVSCPSSSFCGAVAYQQGSGNPPSAGNAVFYNGSGWSAPSNPDPGSGFNAISCTSSTFCMAVDDEGDALIYDGSSWSAPDEVDPGGHALTSVSCFSPTFCGAVDANAGAVMWDGATWSTRTSLPPGGLNSIACPSATFCMAVDGTGNVFTYNGSWDTSPDDIDNSAAITSLSCPSTSFCEAVDYDGNGITYTDTDGNPTWSAPVPFDGELTGVSCTSPTFCAAVQADGISVGGVYYYDGASPDPWSSSTQIESVALPDSISCPSQSFCVVVDNEGNVINGTG